ncbi:hypothetical protein [Aequorivita capsosiphonis]|uniref:hypothetical protein n=1 Tax=Aequorivita capsosiphonis TaxID=487317 RepID=UPI0003FCB238|nr:hypothetical protein [Aequorivita capsosiphonis]
MKKAILYVGALFFMLISNSAFAQETAKESKDSKTENLQNIENSKVKVLVDTSSKKVKNSSTKTSATRAEEKGIGTPDHWHKPNSKTWTTRFSQKLTLNNSVFQIKRSKNGFDLYEKGSSQVYANLVPTPKEGLYRYNSSTKNGAAHFDKKGNLILKYLDNDTGKTKEIQFQSN